MFSRKEKEFLVYPENFNEKYQNVLKSKIRTKLRKLQNDLIIFLMSDVKFPQFDKKCSSGRFITDLKKHYNIQK